MYAIARKVGIAIGLLLVVTACSSAPEQLAERVIEAETGSDVDIDVSDDGASVSIASENGSMAFGGAAEVPAEFPLPVPDGGEPLYVFSSEGTTQLTLLYRDGDFDALVAFYDSWVAGQGEEWNRIESSLGEGDGRIRATVWNAQTGFTGITVRECYEGDQDQSGPPDAVCIDLMADEG